MGLSTRLQGSLPLEVGWQGAAYGGTADGDNLSLSECKLRVLVHIGGLGRGVIVVQGHHLLQCGEMREDGWGEGRGAGGRGG